MSKRSRVGLACWLTESVRSRSLFARNAVIGGNGLLPVRVACLSGRSVVPCIGPLTRRPPLPPQTRRSDGARHLPEERSRIQGSTARRPAHPPATESAGARPLAESGTG